MRNVHHLSKLFVNNDLWSESLKNQRYSKKRVPFKMMVVFMTGSFSFALIFQDYIKWQKRVWFYYLVLDLISLVSFSSVLFSETLPITMGSSDALDMAILMLSSRIILLLIDDGTSLRYSGSSGIPASIKGSSAISKSSSASSTIK